MEAVLARFEDEIFGKSGAQAALAGRQTGVVLDA